MCGLTGFLDFSRTMSADTQSETCRRMADALAHRGPDDHGVWTDTAAGIALGHRRLSIIDLSPLGHQPMASESGRYVVAYNGEIYNFEALRTELAGHHFRGRSDTEVILAAFEQWGVEASLARFNECSHWRSGTHAREPCGWHGTGSERSRSTTVGSVARWSSDPS